MVSRYIVVLSGGFALSAHPRGRSAAERMAGRANSPGEPDGDLLYFHAGAVANWHRISHQQGCIVVANTQSGKPVLLFKTKHGAVNASVYGPTIGFLWTRVDYFRYVQSTKEPGAWKKTYSFRENDQLNLEKCVKDVRGWFKQREKRA